MDIPLIPRKDIFGNPDKTNPQISPCGTRLAYISPVDGVLNIWIKDLEKDEARPITRDSDRGILEYFWSKDGRYIVYLQDQGGNENWRIYTVTTDTGEIRDLTPFDGVQARIIDINKAYPDQILIGLNRSHPELHDAYRLDLTTGELEMIARNQGNVIAWLADPEIKIRGAVMALHDGSYDLCVRDGGDDAEDEWRRLINWSHEDNINSEPLMFTRDGRGIYIIDSRFANAGRLVKIDIDGGEMEVLAEDDQYDVESVVIQPDSRQVQAVAIYGKRRRWMALDNSVAGDLKQIQKLNDGDLIFINRDDTDQKWLVAFEQDTGPIEYYLFNRKKKAAKHLFDHRPELRKYSLAPMEPISFQARDGLNIHGYITYPPGGEKRGLPMVINVHGGPWHRDFWGLSNEAQWLANRGYACLQVNFRGSSGYGKDFLNAGDKEWGRKMHHDLIDAVSWAIDQGLADRNKVAIMGGSYGGYAALVGATFTPDVFRCAVDVFGPSSLVTLIKSIPPYWKTMKATFYKRIGDPDKEEEFLKSRSPLYKVDDVKIPLLIAQGANDPRVTVIEAKQIVDAMKKKGLDLEYMEFADEGHGFLKPENRMKFYAAMEKFLARHLGGRYEE